MRALWLMTRTSLRAFLRDRQAVFFGIAFPLILMGLIGVAFGRQDGVVFTVSVVDEGNPTLARPLLAALQSVPVFRLVREDRAEALERLRQGDRTLVVAVPAHGRTLEAFYEAGRQTSTAALAVLEGSVAGLNLRRSRGSAVLEVRRHEVTAQRVRFFDCLLPGILAMTIAQTAFMGTTRALAEMRENGLLKRVAATPVPPSAFVGGLAARYTATMLFQATVVYLVATWGFGARTHGSLAALALLALAGSVAFCGMGFAVSAVGRTADAAATLGSVVFFPMMFLSGTLWPREMFPEAVRPLLAYLPLSPLVDAMRGVAAYGEPISRHVGAVGSLLAAGALASAAAFRHFRWEE